MAIDFATFLTVAPHVLNSRLPVLIRGRHGVGKSEVVYQIAATRTLPVVERRASQMTEGDLLGLPDTADTSINGRKATTWNAPDWLVTACEQPVLLFLDEVDRATQEVRQGLFELTDSRKINGWHLHPETLIVAAVNGGEHGAQYQVNAMDPAELDRYTVFDVEPTVEEWCSYATDACDSAIVAFIRNFPTHLEHFDEFEPNKVYPSRRSWCRFNDAIVRHGLLADAKANRATISRLATAFLGIEASVKFVDFVVNYDRQVSAADIIEKGRFDRLADFEQTDHMSVVDAIVSGGYTSSKLEGSNLQNFVDYLVNYLPAECAMTLWTSVVGNADTPQDVMTHNMVNIQRSVASPMNGQPGITFQKWCLEVIPTDNDS